MGTVWECIRGMVDPNKSYALKLRLVRMYEAFTFRRKEVQSIECVFHDEKEDRIQVTFPKSVMLSFKDVLEEGQIFGLKNFRLLLNTGKYRVTTSQFKIVVHDLTQLRPIFVNAFPDKRFWFQSFYSVHQLEEDTVDDVALVDVMGALVDMGSVQPKTTASGTEKKILDIVLQDNEEHLLHCTLWDEFALSAEAMLGTQTMTPIIVVLQMCKPNVYRDQKRVNNVLHATKLIINPDVEEVVDFTDRYVAKFGKKPAVSGSVSVGAAASFDEEYVDGVSTKKNIIDLFDDDRQNMYCWIHAVIQSVDFRNGWSYISCPKCKRKVADVDGHFSCVKCGVDDVSAVVRFKIMVRVSDETGIVTLLLWERECSELLGRSAASLAGNIDARDTGECEREIEDALLHKKVYFKIHLRSEQSSNFAGVYNVTKVSAQVEQVPTFTDSQESRFVPMHGNSSAADTSLTIVATPVSQRLTGDPQHLDSDDDDSTQDGALFSTGQCNSTVVLLGDEKDYVTLDGSGVKRCLNKTFAEVTPLKKKRK